MDIAQSRLRRDAVLSRHAVSRRHPVSRRHAGQRHAARFRRGRSGRVEAGLRWRRRVQRGASHADQHLADGISVGPTRPHDQRRCQHCRASPIADRPRSNRRGQPRPGGQFPVHPSVHARPGVERDLARRRVSLPRRQLRTQLEQGAEFARAGRRAHQRDRGLTGRQRHGVRRHRSRPHPADARTPRNRWARSRSRPRSRARDG